MRRIEKHSRHIRMLQRHPKCLSRRFWIRIFKHIQYLQNTQRSTTAINERVDQCRIKRTMQLHASQPSGARGMQNFFNIGRRKNTHLIHALRQASRYLRDLRSIYLPLARSKNEPHRIRPGLHRNQRILNIRIRTNLDPHINSPIRRALGAPFIASTWAMSGRPQPYPAVLNNSRSAAPGSAFRINDSPIKNASYPAARSRRMSAAV